MKDHSLEELRAGAVDILATALKKSDGFWQYESLKQALAHHFSAQEPDQASRNQGFGYRNEPNLSGGDKYLLIEVFWGLVRDGIICPGSDDANRAFPFFRVTQWGRQYLENREPLPFHNRASYITVLRARIPNIDSSTLGFAGEAANALEAGCALAAGLTLCSALDQALNQLFEALSKNANQLLFASLYELTSSAERLERLSLIINQNPKLLSDKVRNDLSTHLNASVAIIQRFHDDSQRSNGQNISREDCAHLLLLFVPACQKIYELKAALT